MLSSVCACASVRVLISGSRFMVRDFQYNEVEMKADKDEMTRLSTDKKKQFVCSLFYSSRRIEMQYSFTDNDIKTPIYAGAFGSMAEGKLQRSLHRVDSHKSSSRLCGVGLKASILRR